MLDIKCKENGTNTGLQLSGGHELLYTADIVVPVFALKRKTKYTKSQLKLKKSFKNNYQSETRTSVIQCDWKRRPLVPFVLSGWSRPARYRNDVRASPSQ